MLVSTFGSDCFVFLKRVTRVDFLSHRWRIQFGGEPRETRREMKHERAMHALSNGPMAGVCYVTLAVGGYYTVSRTCSVLSVLFKCRFLAAACPSTWGTKCLMFTKLLSKETTTTCSSVRALDCRDRLCSKPNSHSGNIVTCHCCVGDRLLLRPESHSDLSQKL